MKTISYILVLFFLGISIKNYAQFSPIEFEGYQPKWVHYFYDSLAADYYPNKDGMTQLFWEPKLILEDSMLYVMYKIIVGSTNADGGYIEKLDVKNREIVWANYFDLQNNDKFENPSSFNITSEGILEITGYRILGIGLFDSKSKFFRREYDTEDGALLEHFYADEADTLAPYLFSAFAWGASQIFPDESKKYKHVTRLGYNVDTLYDKLIYDLNEFGQQTDLNIIKSEKYMKYNFISGRFYKIDEDEYFNYKLSENSYSSYSDTFDYRIFLQYYDRDFVLDRQYEVTDIFRIKDGAEFYFMYVDQDFSILKLWERYDSLHFLRWQTIFYLFDNEGHLLDTVLNLSPVGEYVNYMDIQRISEDEFLIAGSTQWHQKGALNKIYFYKKKIGGDLEFLKGFTIKKENHFVRAHRLVPLENGDILYIGSHGFSQFYNSGYHIDDKGGGWNVMIYFPAEDIGLTTGTEETTQSPRMEIELYPNPASGQIELALASRVSGYVQIFDILGREVIRKTVEDQDHITVATGHLETGNYFVKLYDNKENLLGAKSFVKGR